MKIKILSVALYECEICSLKLWEDYWLRVFENSAEEDVCAQEGENTMRLEKTA
jgi:hypothetical protein